ncbi:hypothetical protein VaNZ11_000371, partial [Volvox africanus]
MYLYVPSGTAGLGQGVGTPQIVPSAGRKNKTLWLRTLRPGGQSQLRCHPVQSQQVGAGVPNKIQKTKADGSEHRVGAGLDLGSIFRSVFDFSSPKVKSATQAAAAAAAGSATTLSPAALALDVGAPISAAGQSAAGAATSPGPFTAMHMAATTGVQPMAALAEQVLAGQDAVQDDPVAAARQLQLFLSQYKNQYGSETDARISAAVAKLQDYIQGYSQQQYREGLGGASAVGGLGAAAGGVGDGASPGDGVVYHNYILEQLTGILDWVNNLLVNNNPKPYMFDAYGRVLDNATVKSSLEQQQEQLRAASNSLRVLIQQLQQVNRQYAAMADPDEKAAMGQVLSQLTTMADRLAVAATRRPLPPTPPVPPPIAIDAAADLAPYVRPEELYGAEKYRDPLLRVLDGVYQAVVVDSGLREFLAGIKQLGDSLVASMAVAWTGAPPIGRLIAYIAAVAGVLFVMRTRLPPALLAPTKLFGQLGAGGGSGASAAAPASSNGPDDSGTAPPPGVTNPSAAAAFAAIAANNNGSSNGQAAAAAAAAAFAAIAANSGGRSAAGGSGIEELPTGPLAAMDRDTGLGDSRLPSEILNSNDPYAARAVSNEPQATPFASGGVKDRTQGGAAAGAAGGLNGTRRNGGSSAGFGNGWANLTGTATSSGSAPSTSSGVFASSSASGGANLSRRSGNGGSNDWEGDRADWWRFGQQSQKQIQPQAANLPASPPPQVPAQSPGGSAPRAPTVAETWEAFRRIQDTAPVAGAIGNTAISNGGLLDTTAALAAAAVAAAAVGSGAAAGSGGTDLKMAELARAAEERRLSKDRARLRATIKDRLRWVCLALGPVSSVVPGGEPLREEVDGLLAQLEALSPTDKPLNTVVDVARRPTVGTPAALVDPMLLGEWRLVYASNASGTAGIPSAASQAAGGGPNLLAQILHIADSLPGFGMTHVVQRLAQEKQAGSVAPAAGGGAAAPATILT